MANTFLVGKKTVLRPLALTDVPHITKWVNDPETRKYLTRRFPLTELAEKAWIEKMSGTPAYPTDIALIIETIDGGQPIGTMGLHGINWTDRKATTGTVIGEAKYRGGGYATDAKMALLEYAFESLGMHKIISHAFSKNVKSVEYSKRCGYEVEAVLKEEIFHKGAWEDMTILSCFYDGWKKAKEKLES